MLCYTGTVGFLSIVFRFDIELYAFSELRKDLFLPLFCGVSLILSAILSMSSMSILRAYDTAAFMNIYKEGVASFSALYNT